ncbi:MAG: hypothetical protein FJZ58_05155 [Chlamydiae bacterium]|nr:hypothetical protein [Chlamydiota bacterium]
MPLMPFLVLLGVIPYCVRYSRTLPLFLIYSLALFGFIVFSTGINALTILGENQVFSPYAALLIPFVLALGSTYWNFHKKLF